MRVNTKVGLLPVGHVFVTPLTRRTGCVRPLELEGDDGRATQELFGVDADLGIEAMAGEHERKALHPDVLVEVAAEDPPLAPPSRGPLE